MLTLQKTFLFMPFFFIPLGEFNDLGIAEGRIDSALFGPISAVRLVIKSASKNWVIISEVSCQ